MVVDEFAEHLLRKCRSRFGSNFSSRNPFFLHVLGPPAIGKSILLKAIYSQADDQPPTRLRAGSFILPRAERRKRRISECSFEAYRVSEAQNALKLLISEANVALLEYCHQTGDYTKKKSPLHSNGFIYLEGPLWLSFPFPNQRLCRVTLTPDDETDWKRCYISRNTLYRRYTSKHAEEAFRLASSGWDNILHRFKNHVGEVVAVDLARLSSVRYRPKD